MEMATTSVTEGAMYADFGKLAQLRSMADGNSEGALKEVAQHFESLFVQMMMKSMREATEGGGLFKDGLFNSDEMKFHQNMMDQQMSLHLSQSGGIGLASIIERQLGGKPDVVGGEIQSLESDWLLAARRAAVTKPADGSASVANSDFMPATQEAFVRELWPHAEKAAKELGVDTEVLVAQAALESGWGKRVIRDGDGSNSFNLFGIKATTGWQGDRVKVGTLEYRDGIANREQASFRAYDSLQGAFDDYVNFLRGQPRYQQALAQSGDAKEFLNGLQAAGYATDPNYAEKISGVMRGDSFRAQVAALKSSVYSQLM